MTSPLLSDESFEKARPIRLWAAEVKRRFGRPPAYFIRTFGCQQNDHDSEIAAGILEDLGFQAAASTEDADLILFNTCSVRENADDRFFGHVGSLKPVKKKEGPIIGVLGCMMEQAVHRDRIYSSFSHVDFILGAGAMELLPQALNQVLFEYGSKEPLDLTDQEKDAFGQGLPVRRSQHHRALLTIMTGCNNYCSYCIVPYTRGREESRSYDLIMEEARSVLDQGAVELMLLGQNVNSYGNDIRKRGEKSPDFAKLLADISQLPGLGLVRYMTSHPKDLSDDLIQAIGRYPQIEPHIHLPLQSGSDNILARMNRRYTAAHYLNLIEKLRASRPGMTITTDLIVGYPGESQADFEDTLRVMETARFDAAFTFIYSPRVGTPAARIYDPSESPLVQKRFEELVRLQNEMSLDSNCQLLGRTVKVLIDGPSRKDPAILSGRTLDDRLVNVTCPDRTSSHELSGGSDQCQAGLYLSVRVDEAGSFSLKGTALDL